MDFICSRFLDWVRVPTNGLWFKDLRLHYYAWIQLVTITFISAGKHLQHSREAFQDLDQASPTGPQHFDSFAASSCCSFISSFLWWKRSNDLVQGQQERKEPSQRIAESTPGMISFTTSSPSTFWEMFIFIPFSLLSPRNFISLLSGFPERGSGKGGMGPKPPRWLFFWSLSCPPVWSYVCGFVLPVPALSRVGACKVAEVWTFSKRFFLKWVYCCESHLFQRGLTTNCSSEAVCTGHRHFLDGGGGRVPTNLPPAPCINYPGYEGALFRVWSLGFSLGFLFTEDFIILYTCQQAAFFHRNLTPALDTSVQL